MELVKKALAFLDGRHDDVIDMLNEEMNRYAEELKFEKAAVIRDRIKSINELYKKQSVYTLKKEERDVIALYSDNWHYAASVLAIRGGRLVGKRGLCLGDRSRRTW